MSRKDYIMLARIIREFSTDWAMLPPEALGRKFASELLNTNPRFDVRKFITACTPCTT